MAEQGVETLALLQIPDLDGVVHAATNDLPVRELCTWHLRCAG